MGDSDEQILETYISACFKFAIVMVPTLLAFIFDVWIVSYCDLSGYKAYLYPSIALLCTYAIYRLLLWAVKLTPEEEDIFNNNFDYPSSPSTENIDANNFAIRIDPKYLGVPNVCFSLSDEDDPREPKYKKQRLERGFDDSEAIWSLDCTIAKFVLPRLKAFYEYEKNDAIKESNPVPVKDISVDEKEWISNLEKMIFAFQFVVNQDHINGSPSEEDKEKYAEGMKLFAENFHRLWT